MYAVYNTDHLRKDCICAVQDIDRSRSDCSCLPSDSKQACNDRQPVRAALCMLCYAICCNLNFAVLCYAMLCYAMLCHAMPCHAMPCHAMLCMLCQTIDLVIACVQQESCQLQPAGKIQIVSAVQYRTAPAINRIGSRVGSI